MKRFVLGLLAATAMSASAMAADVKPAIIYDLGGKFDKSFNEAAFNGAEKFKTESGIAYRDFEIQNDAQREQALRKFAEDGNNPIVMAGFSWAAALEKVAAEFPDLQFAIIDMVVDKPNVRSVVYKEQEGSYVVGVLAAMASKSKKVGFVGGMDIPLISKFGCGYVGGAKAAGATEVIENMTGDTPAAWNDPDEGRRNRQIADRPGRGRRLRGRRRNRRRRAAGGGGRRQARHRRRFQPERPAAGQGPDLDGQARRRRRLQRVQRFAKNGKFTPGINNLGLKEDGVGYAMDDNNKALVTRRDEGGGRKGQGGHHRGDRAGARLHVGQCLPLLIANRTEARRRAEPGVFACPRLSRDQPARGRICILFP